MQKIELFAPGTLGTCWYGKYHYFEPWVGCEHDCDYCYARFRGIVTDTLNAHNTSFAHPAPLLEPAALKQAVRERLNAGDISILKLCRYTDFFSPTLVDNGLAADLLQILVESPVKRVIITTKGRPDPRSIDIMKTFSAKISYNLVAKPRSPIVLEKHLIPLEDRLDVATDLAQAGIQTTIHLDPLVPGIDDTPDLMIPFLDDLARRGLKRVMFSFLLLNPPMLQDLKTRLNASDYERLLGTYQIDRTRQFLPSEHETVYFEAHTDLRRTSAETLARSLKERGFSFVLCSLKNIDKTFDVDRDLCPACDGMFYA
jgi:DNA repair photolyase